MDERGGVREWNGLKDGEEDMEKEAQRKNVTWDLVLQTV